MKGKTISIVIEKAKGNPDYSEYETPMVDVPAEMVKGKKPGDKCTLEGTVESIDGDMATISLMGYAEKESADDTEEEIEEVEK